MRIGASDLDVTRLGLGGNTFGNATDRAASEAVLDAFVDGGGTLIDTADSYSHWAPGNRGGESETIVGGWMRRRGNRDRVVIATKVGGLPGLTGLAPATVAAAADASLRRLGTDRIDLYYAHYEDHDVPVAEAAGAFDELVRAGKVRHVGLSNHRPERIEEWIRVAERDGLARPVALQPAYSLVQRREYERDIAPVAERHGLGVLPYPALANGFLSGKYRTADDLRGAARGPAVEPYLDDDGRRVLDALGRVADGRGTAMATVALAWLLAAPTVTAPLASATSPAQVAELLAATDLRLAEDEVAALDEASRPFA